MILSSVYIGDGLVENVCCLYIRQHELEFSRVKCANRSDYCYAQHLTIRSDTKLTRNSCISWQTFRRKSSCVIHSLNLSTDICFLLVLNYFLTISNRCYLCLCIQLRRCYMQISSCHCILPASLRYRPSTADTVTANISTDRHKILTEWKIGHVKKSKQSRPSRHTPTPPTS